MNKPKIALIGGGQIGGNLALLAAQKELGDVIIFDIPQSEGMVKGKALDITQLAPHDGYDVSISGTSNWDDLKNSDVFIITAGIPKKTWDEPRRSSRYKSRHHERCSRQCKRAIP